MQKKKGISLIVLIIAIIVMIILATAIIISLNNTGIINKANEAVNKTNEAQLKQIAQLGWAEAYANGARTVEGENGLEAGVKNALTANGLNPEEYLINVTTRGVVVKLLSNAWLKDGFTVVKGDKVLKIGELVNYDETAGGKKTGLTNVKWKVLGADDDGNLLIMSASDVKTSHRLGYETTDTTDAEKMEEAQNDWLNGAAELDGICEAYGYGEGVVGKARSITEEDVNAVTGYDPETAENGEPCGYGDLEQYGNEVTYKYNATAGETTPAYTSAVTNGTLSNAHTKGFYYYNEKTGKCEHITDLATGERGKEFAKLTSNSYGYSAPSIPTISATAEDSKEAYQMIFGNNDTRYWLASPLVSTWTSYAVFGLRYLYEGCVQGVSLWYSHVIGYSCELGVRAVVTLSSDIQFTEYTADGWSY